MITAGYEQFDWEWENDADADEIAADVLADILAYAHEAGADGDESWNSETADDLECRVRGDAIQIYGPQRGGSWEWRTIATLTRE